MRYLLFIVLCCFSFAMQAQTMPNIAHLAKTSHYAYYYNWSGNGACLIDGQTSGNHLYLETDDEGWIQLVFENQCYIEGVKIHHNKAHDGLELWEPTFGYADYNTIHSYIPVGKTACKIELYVYSMDIEIYEIEVFGSEGAVTGVEYTYVYNNVGNRIRRTYDFIIETTVGNCGYETLISKGIIKENAESYPDMLSDIDLKFYPNPTMGELVIEVLTKNTAQPKLTYELIDATGRRVWRNKSNEPYFIVDMTDMYAGIYVLRLNYNGETKTYRVIKK